MGYFSNGAEGELYEERYCERCIHRPTLDDEPSCAVWVAHLLYNYRDCNDKDSVLHILIPRTEDGLGNEQCALFLEEVPDA